MSGKMRHPRGRFWAVLELSAAAAVVLLLSALVGEAAAVLTVVTGCVGGLLSLMMFRDPSSSAACAVAVVAGTIGAALGGSLAEIDMMRYGRQPLVLVTGMLCGGFVWLAGLRLLWAKQEPASDPNEPRPTRTKPRSDLTAACLTLLGGPTLAAAMAVVGRTTGHIHPIDFWHVLWRTVAVGSVVGLIFALPYAVAAFIPRS
jgi:hypothetical protein